MAVKHYTPDDIDAINASYTPMGTLPTTLSKDESQYKRYEDVSYRYRLYNKNGIYLSLTVYRIEELGANKSKRVMDYNERAFRTENSELFGPPTKTTKGTVIGWIDADTRIFYDKSNIEVLHNIEYKGNNAVINDTLTQLNTAKTKNTDVTVQYTCSPSSESVSVTYHPAYTMEFSDGTILDFSQVMAAIADSSATDDKKLDAFLKTSVSYKNNTVPIVKECKVETKADLDKLPKKIFSRLIVYVKDEDTYYGYNETCVAWRRLPWLTCTYGACFYILYKNDNTKETFCEYYIHNLPSWKTIEEAKAELSSLNFQYYDFTANGEYTFYIQDSNHSHLLDPTQENTLSGLGAGYYADGFGHRPGSVTIYPTKLLPKAKGVAYAVSVRAKSEYLFSSVNPYEGTSSISVEGVQANGGKSRISYLLQRWKKLDTDSSEYLALADATKSEGYAKINTGVTS